MKSPYPDERPIVVGIQGGRGSFNEEAAKAHLPTYLTRTFDFRYLHTTEAVLRCLAEGAIDLGQFALYNTLGGAYEETLDALGVHRFRVMGRYALSIRHALLAHPSSKRANLSRILTHPAVVHQCAESIRLRLPDLPIEYGTGDYLDPARVALAIATGELPATVATVSNPSLASELGLVVLENGLQDAPSVSWFLLVAPAL